jgi:hypothetical protein
MKISSEHGHTSALLSLILLLDIISSRVVSSQDLKWGSSFLKVDSQGKVKRNASDEENDVLLRKRA